MLLTEKITRREKSRTSDILPVITVCLLFAYICPFVLVVQLFASCASMPKTPNASSAVPLMNTETGAATAARAPAGMVYIKAGVFMMGCASGTEYEKPVRTVRIEKSFYISKTEVTQDEWFSVMKTKPSAFDGKDLMSAAPGEVQGQRPVEMVSWHEAVLYCNERSRKEKLTPVYFFAERNGNKTVIMNEQADGYRLPTEAEWEYCASSGFSAAASASVRWPGVPYGSGASVLKQFAWYADNADFITHETGTKMKTSAGLYDMAGNVREWCWDKFASYENSQAASGSFAAVKAAAADETMRVWRGGGADSPAEECTVSVRAGAYADSKNSYTGFRVVRNAHR